jgi:UPF0716 protein FxsA
MEGTRIIMKIQESLRAGIMPTEDLLNGLLVLAAGMFLIVPGFLSDVFGLLLLFPPSRYPIRRLLRRATRNWIVNRTLRISV